MKHNEDHTPTERAYAIALNALNIEFHDRRPTPTSKDTPRRLAERRAIAKLHNGLLEKSGLDGHALYEDD